ncbi:hypothetical protein, partial [Bacteroides fragilis]
NINKVKLLLLHLFLFFFNADIIILKLKNKNKGGNVLDAIEHKMFLCNSNIGNVLVTSEFFFYWKLLYTIAYKVIKNEYIGWMFFC